MFLAAGLLTACQDASPAPPPAAPAPSPVRTTPATRPAPGKISAIGIDAFFTRQQTGAALIYDARPNFVAGFGKIPGAINWPAARFEQDLPRHETEIRSAGSDGRLIVVYCTDSACPDARALAEKIAARGHDVCVFEGGYAEWKTAGLPVE